jgi:hypothetical protein
MWMGVGVKETAGLAQAKSGQPRSDEIRVAKPEKPFRAGRRAHMIRLSRGGCDPIAPELRQS